MRMHAMTELPNQRLQAWRVLQGPMDGLLVEDALLISDQGTRERQDIMASTMKTPMFQHSSMRQVPDLAEIKPPQMVATVLGGVFLLVGMVGFVVPDLLHAHLGMAHNVVHLASGAMALAIGIWGTTAVARMFDFMFGTVYGLLGIVGF